MAYSARELAELVQVLTNASESLVAHARDLLARLVDALPNDEPTPLTASAHGVTGSSMTAELVWNNSGTGNPVTIDWGVVDVVDDEEPAVGTKTYQYADAGQYVVTVTDQDDPLRTVGVPVTVPFVTGA
jgi:hypothetical protein